MRKFSPKLPNDKIDIKIKKIWLISIQRPRGQKEIRASARTPKIDDTPEGRPRMFTC